MARSREGPIHPSYERMLQAAVLRTRGRALGDRIVDGAGIARALDETTATITNWKSRGVSIPGAVKAEKAFGIPAVWTLYEEHPTGWASRPDRVAISADVLMALEALDPPAMQKVENLLRAHLDLPPTAPRLGGAGMPTAAAQTSSAVTRTTQPVFGTATEANCHT